MKYKTVISDAGDILFSTETQREKKKQVIGKLLERSSSKEKLNDIVKKFKPYNDRAQTTHHLWDMLRLFAYNELNISLTKEEAKKIARDLYPTRPTLFEGVLETLEELKSRGISFITLSNGPCLGKEYYLLLEKNVRGLIDAQVSSKDLGIRKPNPMAFQAAYSALKGSQKREEILYISHTLPEIMGASTFGFSSIACRYQNQNDAQEISERIEKSHQKIFKIANFRDILNLID